MVVTVWRRACWVGQGASRLKNPIDCFFSPFDLVDLIGNGLDSRRRILNVAMVWVSLWRAPE
jgi:hypothetical protein